LAFAPPEKEGNNMIAGVFEIRRSVAVIVVACLLIVGGVTGAVLSSWAKHNPVAVAPPASIGVSGKNAEAGPPNAMGFAPVSKLALAAVVNISSSRIVKTPQAPFSPFFDDALLSTISWRSVLSANAARFRRHCHSGWIF
jgi:hypothetical protein